MLRKIFFLAFFIAVGCSLTGYSQTNTAQANADAEMSLPIAMGVGNFIEFGGFMPGATPGTVVLPANSNFARYATGGVTLVAGYSGQVSEGFVYGEPDAAYAFTLPSSPVSIKLLGNPAIEMTLTDVSYHTDSGVLQLESGGYQTVYFGGTLNVAADQPKGTYTGTFNITTAYN